MSLSLTPTGFEFPSQSGADSPSPQGPLPVYANDAGDTFIVATTDDGPVAVPYLTGSPAGMKPTTGGWAGPLNPLEGIGSEGGYVPLDALPPQPPGEPGFADVMTGILQNMPQQVAQTWLTGAVQNAMLGAGPGGVMSAAMGALGVNNPLASGPFAGALSAAAGAVGLGPVGNLLPSLGGMLGGGNTAAMGNALGAMGLNQALGAAGLGNIPGAAAAANILGGQLGNLAGDLGLGDTLGDALGGIANPIDGCFPGGGGTDILGEGGVIQEQPQGIDTNAITEQGLDAATDKLLSQWQVDDESSAAEHIAHKAVNDYKNELQELLKGEALGTEGGGLDGLMNRISSFFSGAPAGTGQPAARMTDTDLTKPEFIDMGVANILVEKLPVSRISDTIAPSKSMILVGSATVLSAGLPTARMTSKTDSPGVMIEKGAPTVLIGGAAAAIDPPAIASKPNVPSVDAPKGPADAKSTGSGSSAGEGEGNGKNNTNTADDSTAGAGGEGNEGESKQNQANEGQQNGSNDKESEPDNDLKDIQEKEEILKKFKNADTAAKAKTGLEQERLDKEALEQKTKAQNEADELAAEAEKSKADLDAAQSEANRATREADGRKFGAQSKDDFKDSVKAQQDATAAKQAATRAKINHAANATAAQQAQSAADDLPAKGTLKGGSKALKVASDVGGPLLDVAESGLAIAKMKELGEQGEDRALVRTATSTIGGLGAGIATVAIASTGVGVLFLVAGGVALGVAGTQVGDQVGDAIADYGGYENRSGTREDTWWDDTKQGASVISNGVSDLFGYW